MANPRLLAIAGQLRDSAFGLANNEITLGRDPANLVSVPDPSLSRRHCVLRREGDHWVIRDLESRNGTYVNGVASKEIELRHGDQLSVGDSVFVFLTEDEAEPAPGGVEFDDLQTHATSQLRPQDVLYLQPERVLRELPGSSRVGHNLAALLRISGAVHAIRDLEKLQETILHSLFEVTPAERGAILLDRRENGEFALMFARHRISGASLPVRISRTITSQAFEQKVAILGADVPGSGDLRAVGSLLDSKVRSLLCVPLTVFEKVVGCIYLDSTSGASRFDDDHLQLAAGIAGFSALALENARRLQWLEQENLRLTTEINLDNNMVGESPLMKNVYQVLSKVAPTDSNVLIEGESGTGKELVARAIHRNSVRSKGPFVTIDCAAIPEGLLESELFGHERGAFTGAVSQKKGRLEMADGGVVFLDEIGEMPLSLQVKLLRVLQEREFERVGGNRPISVDIRLIAATNRDLEEAVQAGAFRRDLYYRLNVVKVAMPPLRERREDIATLAQYFVVKCAKKCKVRPKPISPGAMECLTNSDWPGNVRELENAIERALVLGTSEMIELGDLPESLLEQDLPSGVAAAKYHAAVREFKRELIMTALHEAKGNYTEAARTLGVHPNNLHRLIRNLNLKQSLSTIEKPRPTGTQGRF